MKVYEKYTVYPALWNKRFPSHWDVLPMYAVAKEKNICNCIDLPLLSVYLDVGVIPFSEKAEKRTNVTSKDLSKYQRVDSGDFVLNNQQAWRGSVGVSFYTGIVSPAYIVLSINDLLNSKYANYLFRTHVMVDQYLINSKSVGSIQRNIYWPALKRIRIIAPPRIEQEQIVRFLDWKVSIINKLIRIKRQQIIQLEEMKKISINDAVTGKLSGVNSFVDSGFDYIGKIPSHWQVIKLKWLLSTSLQYGANSTGVEYDESLPRYIRITDITLDNKLKDVGKQSLPADIAQPYILDDGDLLFARSGATVGKTFIYKKDYGDAAYAGYLIRAKVDNTKALPEYVYAVTLSKFYELWKNRIFIQATIQNISAERYNNLPIPLPPIEEQKDIIQTIATKVKSIEAAIEKTRNYIEELINLKICLISDAVTGKIDVRDIEIPEYEFVDEDVESTAEDSDDEAVTEGQEA